MNGLVRNTTARLSRRFDGYEPLDGVMRSDEYSRSRRDGGGGQRRRSLSFKHKKAAVAADIISPLRTREDRAKQRRQIFLNSYKFASTDQKLQRSTCRRLKKVAAKVKTAAAKLLSSLLRIRAFGSSCNCGLAIRASSPTPRGK